MKTLDAVSNHFAKLKEINTKYGLDTEILDYDLESMKTPRVCLPVIGRFSTGKSALINAIMGRDILKEDITAETAVPTEITWTDGDDRCVVVREPDGQEEEVTWDALQHLNVNAREVRSLRLFLNLDSLREFKDVTVVDMPGFESGYPLHDKAIDAYLPRSMAYILAYPADDMILKATMKRFLKELSLHHMPVALVITKCDKKNDQFEETRDKLAKDIKACAGLDELPVYETSSHEGDVQGAVTYLKQIQDQSQELLARKYEELWQKEAEKTKQNLQMRLESSGLTESELSEKEEELKKQMAELSKRLETEKMTFQERMTDCVSLIKNDVLQELESNEGQLISMATTRGDVAGAIKQIVRSALTTSMKCRFMPEVERYLSRVETSVQSDAAGDIHVSFAFDVKEISDKVSTLTIAGATGYLTSILFGGLLGVAAAIGAYLFGMHRKEEQEEEQENAIREKLEQEVFPDVMKQVGTGVEKSIETEMTKVNEAIEKDIESQKTNLTKALDDVRRRAEEEKAEKEERETSFQEDLAVLEQLSDEAAQEEMVEP